MNKQNGSVPSPPADPWQLAGRAMTSRLIVGTGGAPSLDVLGRVLAAWTAERRLIVCDESGAGEPIGAAAARLPVGPLALLVGPEGGFDQTELDALGKLSFVSRVGLGPRVLRAETAALAALAVYQATAGDWRHTRSR